MFAVGVIAASLAAVAYGLSTVLRALGARRASQVMGAPADGEPTVSSTLAAFKDPTFLMGTALVMIGFAGGAVAARLLPLFLSQTIVSANLIITAMLGMAILGTHLKLKDWGAMALVVAALCMLGASASKQASTEASELFHWLLFVVSVSIAVIGLGVMHVLGRKGAIFAGALAGLMYGALAVAVRVLDGIHPFNLGHMLADPAAWTIAIAGAMAFYVQTVALQLGPVNGVTAVLVVGETGGPAVIGVVFLGDRAIAGLEWLAIVGFVGAIVGAVLVAWLTASEKGDEDAAIASTISRRRAPDVVGAGDAPSAGVAAANEEKV